MKRRFQLALLALSLGSLVWGFRALLFNHAPAVFSNPQEDMSFAWFVPLFSLYVLWTSRSRLKAAFGRPDPLAFALLLPSLAIGFLGVRGIQVRFEMLAFAGLLIALPWAIGGRALARAVLFPAVFLLFCLPLATFLDVVTVHLRLFASSAAFAVLKGFGADVVRRGTMIGSANGSFAIDVADPCSGIRSLFALMALTVAYAHFTQRSCWRRALLFVLSVPLAILGNVVRILTICLVANYASATFAAGFYHDYSGYVVFLVAILAMVAAGEAMNRVCGRTEAMADVASHGVGESALALPMAGSSRVFALLACSLTVAIMAVLPFADEPSLAEPPSFELGELEGYASEPVEAAEAERKVLPPDTRIEKRLYRNAEGEWFLVSAIVGGRDKRSIHRPELCLPAQGFQMSLPETVRAGEADWRFLHLANASGESGYAYTFFNQEGFRTASHVRRIFRDVWDRSVRGRIDRWAMVAVSSSRADALRLAIFLDQLARDVLP